MEAGGGPAATAAVTLARLEIPVAFIGQVGDDTAGERIRSELQREGVDVRALRTVAGTRSAASVVIVNVGNGERSIAAFPGTFGQLELTQDDLDLCASAEWVHADDTGNVILSSLRTAGVATPVSLDAGNPIEHLDLSLVTLYAPTERALRKLFRSGDIESAIAEALTRGPSIVVVSRGAEGSIAAARSGWGSGSAQTVRAPAFPARAVSTLGAGDVFHGALLAALLRGSELDEALRYANAAAALSCAAIDGRSAIPSAAALHVALETS